MPIYQRKRETIEAVQFTAEHGDQINAVGHLPPGLLERVRPREAGGFELEGRSLAFGDYVVKQPKGHPSVATGVVFEAIYEPAPAVPAPPAAVTPPTAPARVAPTESFPPRPPAPVARRGTLPSRGEKPKN